MSTLTGKKFKNYYKSLLHLEDELTLTSTKKFVHDGDGNAFPFKVSSLGVEFTGTVEGVTKTHVGLPLVENIAPGSMPVSTLQAAADTAAENNAKAYADSKIAATITNGDTTHSPDGNSVFDALALKQNSLGFTPEDAAQKGIAGGYASLDGTGKVPSAQLPSFVDDVIEAANFAALPGTGETSKIYVTLNDNKTYRWSGSAYVEISASPGSTDSVTEGATNLYFTAARVLATVITGVSFVTGTAITAADTVLAALGKLQKQITDLGTTVGGIVSATITSIASIINGATGKTTPVDADTLPLIDSAASNALKKVTWANIKATLVNTWKDTTGGFVGMTLFKINFKNAANTITSFFENANTVSRTYTFPDKDGIVAMTSDISGGAGGAYILKTANYTLTDTEAEGIVDCTGTHTQTLPTAVGRSGKKFTIKNSGTGIITVNTTSSQTIDGDTSVRINTKYNTRTFQSDGANWVIIGISFTNLQIFTASGTWSKPAGAKFVQVIALGGGGGGASGRRGAASSLRCGGGGGGSGMLVNLTLLASVFGDTETVTIGAGGIGAAAITADDTNGTIGGNAGDTLVGSLVKAFRGFSGVGGTAATSANGGGGQGILNPQMEILGQNGGNGSTFGTGGTGGNQDVYLGPSAGGGGGGIDASNNVRNGGVGGRIQQNGATGSLNCPIANFTNVAAAAVSTDGGVSIALPNYGGMTIGGGGGGGNGNGNNGGDAGGPGAGGGGGGASLNGTNSGAGGNGGDGWCVMITYF